MSRHGFAHLTFQLRHFPVLQVFFSSQSNGTAITAQPCSSHLDANRITTKNPATYEAHPPQVQSSLHMRMPHRCSIQSSWVDLSHTQQQESQLQTLKQLPPTTLAEASSKELFMAIAERLGHGIWSLSTMSLSTTSNVLSALAAQAHQQAIALAKQAMDILLIHTFAQLPSPQPIPGTPASSSPTAADQPLPVNTNSTPPLPNTSITLDATLPIVAISNRGLIQISNNAASFVPWSSGTLPLGYPKIVAMVPAKPDRTAELETLSNAIDRRHFPEHTLRSFTIVNLEDLPGPAAFNRMTRKFAITALIDGASQRQDLSIIADRNGLAQQTWGLDKNTCYTFLLDEHNHVVAGKSGPMELKDCKQFLNWTEKRIHEIDREGKGSGVEDGESGHAKGLESNGDDWERV